MSMSDLEADQPVAYQHSLRFRQVSNGYPHVVAEAYGGDITAAALETDEAVAQRVADWERSQGIEPRDWTAIGIEEGRDPEEDAAVEQMLRDMAEHPEQYDGEDDSDS